MRYCYMESLMDFKSEGILLGSEQHPSTQPHRPQTDISRTSKKVYPKRIINVGCGLIIWRYNS